MRTLPLKPLAVLAPLLALGLHYDLSAAEEPPLEAVIVNRDTVVLHVAKLADEEGGLPGVQEYALQVSENLSDWEELARTDLLESVEVPDFEGRGRSARFYRLIGLPVSATVRLFAEEFSAEVEELSEFASGIALDGVTLAEYQEMRGALAALEADIVALIESGAVVPESLLTLYRERLGGIDQILAANPLRLEWEGRSYEVEVSKAMRVLNEEYRRLGRVSLSGYDRLPGVDAGDLEGHEDLQAYLGSRSAGRSVALPVFDALSPFGNYTLIHALVSKHLDILSESETDDDLDGAFELDYALFRRLLNGSERALREGVEIVDTLREASAIAMDTLAVPALEAEDLAEVLLEVDAYLGALDQSLRENVTAKEYESVFEAQLLLEASRLYNEEEYAYYKSLSEALWHPNRSLTLFSEYDGPLPDSPATEAGLLEVKDAIEAWGLELAASIVDFLEPLDLTRSWRERVESVLLAKLNGYSFEGNRRDGHFEMVYDRLAEATVSGEVAIQVDGVGSVIIDESHDLWRSFPSSRQQLLELEAVASVVSEEELAGFSLRSDWEGMRTVQLSSEAYPESDDLSEFGRRIQLMGALIAAYVDQAVGEDGELLEGALARIAAFGADVRRLLEAAELASEEGVAALEAIDFERSDSLSPDEFEAILEVVEAVCDRLADLRSDGYGPLSGNRFELYDFLLEEQHERFFERLRELTGLGHDTLWSKPIRVRIEGRDHLVDGHWLRHTVSLAGQRVGFLYERDSRLTRRQLARLSGVSEEEARALERRREWQFLAKYSLFSTSYILDGYDRAPQDYETYFVFIPRLLEEYGSAIVGETGEIERYLLEDALLADRSPAVERGNSILAEASKVVNKHCANAQRQIDRLDFSEWSAWEESEEHVLDAKRAIAEEAAPLVVGLGETELDRLASQLRSGTASSPYSLKRALTDLTEVTEVTLRFEDGDSWILDPKGLGGAIQIPRTFPEYEFDLSRSGVTESDLAAGRALRSDLVLNESGELGQEDLYGKSGYDWRKVAVATLRRLHDDPSSAPLLYVDSLVVDGRVVLETFRRYVNGIDRIHAELVAEAEEKSNALRRELDRLLAEPVSVQRIERAYMKLRELKQGLTGRLEHDQWEGTAGDVAERGEAVTKAYQKSFDRLMDALNYSPLWLELDGELVEVPYASISRSLLEELGRRFPGESIAAHHYARFYGISVADLRRYDKLEQFLGNQIVAVSSGAQTVEVVSKLSDIGMRQLVADLLLRYAAEVFDPESGKVDLGLLIELVSDESVGLERALVLANELFDERMAELVALEPVETAEDLEAVSRVLIEARESIELRLLDDVSALSEASLEATQALVDERYREMRELVDASVFGKQLRISQIDGGSVSLDISEYEEEIAAKLEELVEKYESVQEGDILRMQRVEGWYFPVEYWVTEPGFNSEDTPTRLGLHVLVARLVAAYGGSVVDDGAFDLEAFFTELENEDGSRGLLLIERLEASEGAKWDEALPANDGPISVAGMEALTKRFEDSNAAYSRLYERLGGARDAGLAAVFQERLNRNWLKRVERYEFELTDRAIRIEREGIEVVLETGELLAMLNSIYGDGATALLDAYALGGESWSQYGAKRSLHRFYAYGSTIRVAPESGFALVVGGDVFGSNLGALNRLPGIRGEDLDGLDVESEDRVAVVQIEPESLLVGDLDLRVFDPGSGVQVGTLDYASQSWQGGWRGYFPRTASRFSELSWRATLSRVLIPMVREHWDELVAEAGEIDFEALEALLWEAEEGG